MKNYLSIKEQLRNACAVFVNNSLETVTNVIDSNKRALHSETKSSAGDKHETGRAMLQLEMEKAGQQLVGINLMIEILDKVSIEKSTETACLGSLIITTKATYFLAISIGKISVEKEDYFVISVQSPVGKQLLGKKVEEIISFNKAKILAIL